MQRPATQNKVRSRNPELRLGLKGFATTVHAQKSKASSGSMPMRSRMQAWQQGPHSSLSQLPRTENELLAQPAVGASNSNLILQQLNYDINSGDLLSDSMRGFKQRAELNLNTSCQ